MKKMHIIAILFVALGIAAAMTLVNDSETYATFDKGAELPAGKAFTVVGEVDLDKPMKFDPMVDANSFSFYMSDEDGKVMKVVYKGAKPQDFEKSDKITVKGKIKDDVFYANKLLMKCPSKYIDENLQTAKTTD